VQTAVLRETTDKPCFLPRTVLVIDDDESYRVLVRTLLVRAGYQVLEASNGLDGLRLITQKRVDLLITDMIMPEHEGVETILRVHQLHPRLKIVAMSGVTARAEYLGLADRLGVNATLEKALVPRLLVRTVRSLLDPS